MRIPDAVKKCVVFIGVEVQREHGREIIYLGTGFIVSVKSSVKRMSFLYLVTARHIVANIAERDYYIRANTKDGKSCVFKAGASSKWWFHPKEDSSADVAVFPLLLPNDIAKTLDYVAIPTTGLLTDDDMEKEGIGEGDEVFIVGLFSYHFGSNKNLPIVRSGNIAMISEEPVQTRKFGDMEAYLIEARSIGGLSGSPVFVAKPKENKKWLICPLGLVHGHWEIGPEKIIDVTTEDISKQAGVNTGIAIVVPAKKILETVNREELSAQRAKLEAAYITKHSPAPD
jgi:hypothetical protein